jgi:hypothetical protein
MSTIYLTPGAWDMTVDASNNIAMATPPYSLAQDVASACRLQLGECWYDITVGIPYQTGILGQPNVPLSYIKGQLVQAALRVAGIVSAQVFVTSLTNRTLTGQIQVETDTGQTLTIGL